MRRLLLAVPGCLLLFAGNPKPADLPLIDRLQELVQQRFDNPLPGALGMSRLAAPSSMGKHFQPLRTAQRDFIPENDRERELIGKLEANGVQAGLYVVGPSILKAAQWALEPAALKGPAAITRGTARPAWYPGAATRPAPDGALPDWNAIYPVARRAMRSFEEGGAGFETVLDGWDIAARPVHAGARCVLCHGNTAHTGGVLYAFRRGLR